MDMWHMLDKFHAEVVDSSSDEESDQSTQTVATAAAPSSTSTIQARRRCTGALSRASQKTCRATESPPPHKDYFHHTDPVYRMSTDLFMVILRGVRNYDPYFQCRPDATGALDFTSYQKCSAAIRMLSYGMAVDIFDEYLRMGENTCIESIYRFCRAVIIVFREHYCREPTVEDTRRLLSINESRGFLGMIGSIDCMHWEWKNCPFG
ncbi:hypothetical protein QYE76_067064 [Lolium multiflorum]|uniref:Uncharacterized protein n=1 Tax=Lolium multiflorum TaxID=4521 RepID=A0AAD8SC47_LOLMU|nr:hypothetical protein QYE76_067064 [Lolium multiflorum]